jgi:hypothetical protein
MDDLRQFIGQLIRLLLIVAGILLGREFLVRLPMVDELRQVPGIGVSGYDLITALAYVAVLAVLVGFVRQVDEIVAIQPGGFPWQTLLAQALILGGIVVAYHVLGGFAAALLGPDRYWAYSAAFLVLATVPVYGIGKLVYEFLSHRIERWEG